MNRIICILLSVMLFSATSFAQKKAETPKQKPAKETAAPTKETGKMKKDGTPDMRYAENKKKKEEKPAGPTKKDGTPDMRYKANKDAAAKKK